MSTMGQSCFGQILRPFITPSEPFHGMKRIWSVLYQNCPNCPNCPEARPIEKFWALAKSYLRKHIKPSQTIEKFERDWTKVAEIVANQSVQNLMASVRSKVRSLAYEK